MNNVPTRSGSSRADFVRVDPRICTPNEERRPSQMSGINLALQYLIDDWNHRFRSGFDFDDEGYSNTREGNFSIKIPPTPDLLANTVVITVVFPWIMTSVECSISMTLSRLKTELFDKITSFQSSSFSSCAADYVFRTIRSDTGEMDVLYNEECEICKLDLSQPFPMLFLYQPEGAEYERELAKCIGETLNCSLEQLENGLSDELKSFRANLFNITSEAIEKRGNEGFEHYAFPEANILDYSEECPIQLKNKIKSSNIHFIVYYRSREDEEACLDSTDFSVDIAFEEGITPVLLVKKAVQRFKSLGEDIEDSDDFVLQLVGQKSFLSKGDVRLVSYEYVRSLMTNYICPSMLLRRKDIVLVGYPKPRAIVKPSYVHAEECKQLSLDNKDTKDLPTSLWSIDENLVVKPVSYSNMSAHHEHNSQIVATFTFLLGNVKLAEIATAGISPRNPRWLDPSIWTGIYMKDIPESAILAIQLFEVRKERSKKASKREEEKRESESDATEHPRREGDRHETFKGWPEFFDIKSSGSKKNKAEDRYTVTPIGFANIPVFDWKSDMQLGHYSVNLYSGEEEQPKGSKLGSNEMKGMASIRLSFDISTTVSSRDSSRLHSCKAVEDSKWNELYRRRYSNAGKTQQRLNPNDPNLVRLHAVLKDRLLGRSLNDEEEKLAWEHRDYIMQYLPDALVLLIESKYTWETRESFGDIYGMLYVENWNRLSIGGAITILTMRNSDRLIRKHAVQMLNEALDCHSFPLYILPLIQALKSEVWARSDLSFFLLERALKDYRTGHKLFWLLRAELMVIRDEHGTDSELFKRFALLIEAYLRGNHEHLGMIMKQVEMVEYLSKLTLMVKGCGDKSAATKRLREELRENCTTIEHIDSPLDPSNMLGELLIEKCKVLGSAKMPLRLSWKNVNPLSELHQSTYEIIFKNGDDLRQDMLVLQVLELMDSLWKCNQLDCCLIPYPVLPTGIKVGMIGVVSNCCTIFEIQSEGSKMGTAVKSLETTFINKYVRSHGGDTKSYLECVDRFLMSCVGYSVATFVMGIKDRHNDNIMLTGDGKLFHIDFGHILGHGKTKLGIQRDRVPFVLTEHFLCVIGKGKPVSKDSHELNKFRQLCIDAYFVLWSWRELFLSVFTTMKSMQLPELSTDSDLDYLKKCLCVAEEDADTAKKYFADIFEEAFNGSWSTKTNWFFHSVKHL